MRDIQEKVNDLIKKYDLESSLEIRYIDLVSEVGELGKEILKGNDYGKKDFCNTENLESEIGDVLFSLVCIANGSNIDLQDAFYKVLKKYKERFLEKVTLVLANRLKVLDNYRYDFILLYRITMLKNSKL